MASLDSFIWASGKTDKRDLGSLLGAFRSCCEQCEIAPDGTWTLLCKLAEPAYRNIADGEFEDLLRQHFPMLFDLKRFEEARFELTLLVGGEHPGLIRLSPSLVAMLAALNMEVNIMDGDPPASGKEGGI